MSAASDNLIRPDPCRRPPWLGVVAAVIVCAGVAFLSVSELRTWRRHTVEGPASPFGNQVAITVSDCSPFNVGSDYYADVEIRDSDGKIAFVWEDPAGQ